MLATTGADELSELALQLENAAKKEDKYFCAENYPKFLTALEKLHDELSVVFKNLGV
jgi:hypothetical protein